MATKQNTREYPIHVIRENLRQSSLRQAALLSRSVGRLTSCDAQPCLEYRAEIAAEHAVIDRLLYVQQCRDALERCIATGAARLRYRWQDGHVTDTRFRKTSPGRVKVSGLPGPVSVLGRPSGPSASLGDGSRAESGLQGVQQSGGGPPAQNGAGYHLYLW